LPEPLVSLAMTLLCRQPPTSLVTLLLATLFPMRPGP
jgi:hypothetical protein